MRFLVLLIFHTILFASQSEIVIGTYPFSDDAKYIKKNLDIFIAKDVELKSYLDKNLILVKYKKVDNKFVVTLGVFLNENRRSFVHEKITEKFPNSFIRVIENNKDFFSDAIDKTKDFLSFVIEKNKDFLSFVIEKNKDFDFASAYQTLLRHVQNFKFNLNIKNENLFDRNSLQLYLVLALIVFIFIVLISVLTKPSTKNSPFGDIPKTRDIQDITENIRTKQDTQQTIPEIVSILKDLDAPEEEQKIKKETDDKGALDLSGLNTYFPSVKKLEELKLTKLKPKLQVAEKNISNKQTPQNQAKPNLFNKNKQTPQNQAKPSLFNKNKQTPQNQAKPSLFNKNKQTPQNQAKPSTYNNNKSHIQKTKNFNPITRQSLRKFIGTRILVAEDNLLNQKIISEIFSGNGIYIEMVNDGKEMIETLRNNSTFSLILMDTSMPNMDGFEATKIIRSNPAYKNISIIGISCDASEYYVNKMYDCGMIDYLEKPLRIKEVYSILEKYILI